MMANLIQARISIDDWPCCLLSIENTRTGTEDRPTYRVTLDLFRERRIITAEIKDFERGGKTRLDLLAEAFKVIAAVQDAALKAEPVSFCTHCYHDVELHRRDQRGPFGACLGMGCGCQQLTLMQPPYGKQRAGDISAILHKHEPLAGA